MKSPACVRALCSPRRIVSAAEARGSAATIRVMITSTKEAAKSEPTRGHRSASRTAITPSGIHHRERTARILRNPSRSCFRDRECGGSLAVRYPNWVLTGAHRKCLTALDENAGERNVRQLEPDGGLAAPGQWSERRGMNSRVFDLPLAPSLITSCSMPVPARSLSISPSAARPLALPLSVSEENSMPA